MRVLLWASTLQADILALALHLDQRPGCQLLVALQGLHAYLRDPINQVRPISSRMVERTAPDIAAVVAAFRPDIVVCDNHFPEFAAAPRVCLMWHGLGWKSCPDHDVAVRFKHVRRLTGVDPRVENPRLIAQCYHERDRAWRIDDWGMAPENCEVVGSCFSDLLLAPPYTREDLIRFYHVDITARPTLLVNLTWHYGRIFPGSWKPTRFRRSPMDEDLTFFRSVLARAADHRANALVCLHDSWRYEAPFRAALYREAGRFRHVEMKHKDEHPDNLADLLVSDAMVSNLSSFVTFFYHLGRSSVHLCPSPGRKVHFMRQTSRGPRAGSAGSGTKWMNPPEDNGGLTAFDAESALAAIDEALTKPDCCRERARDWLDRHIHAPDGRTARRMADALERQTIERGRSQRNWPRAG
ncbi:MAG: hypothetical protein PHU25_11940 [Deltaproteobacteria bacterium]|nr:hypothetical protein [Deltaproteobacteria bacterium]